MIPDTISGITDRRKSSLRDLFRRNGFLLCAKRTARENRKETLLRKASEADAHVVSFGLKVRGDEGERVPSGHNGVAVSEPEESTETSRRYGSNVCDD